MCQSHNISSLINYVISLPPHKIKDTVSVNEGRRLILRLSHPLAIISQNIDSNIVVLERRKDELKDSNKSIEELKTKLRIPTIKLQVEELAHPRTVCTDSSCVDNVPVIIVLSTGVTIAVGLIFIFHR